MGQLSLLKHLPHPLLREGRRYWSRPRYWYQHLRARVGYLRFGERYSQPLLFVAGLPKSGTSWLESMLATYPGYHPVMIPEAVDWEIRNRGSHNLQLPDNTIDRLKNSLAVLKLHLSGLPSNAKRLHQSNQHYVILFRDLRDVAVSHYFYVSRTPWHPEYPDYANLNVVEGLHHFADTLLDPYVRWLRSWKNNRNPSLSLVVTYEQMLDDAEGTFSEVASHFDLDTSVEKVKQIVRIHEFENRSGRPQGEEDQGSFLRKGVAGDWKSYFTSRIARRFERQAGNFLNHHDELTEQQSEP